ncbi:SAM-dependent methyltransferase [Actinoallomurus bryophytorum]|uniref:S-adenosyl-L-methionine-dependent methyltransferase n=1 Tax=Actinoallomurus bryophytorum TaxID=1490222 RepID=A0A543CUF5_9ACTN|nr:SAM-dependent methyltransferase [Actinoallomurus bryophytorum]TQM00691.1 methyltransferase (TIGR00027 family) [Actinoallomurus bryophytorum]
MSRDISEIDAIGRTAFEVAALRAAETRRADRLFEDPYAEMFLDAAGVDAEPTAAKAAFAAIMGVQAAVRTRFLDEALVSAASSGCRQVVLLAAGMDSRAHRIAWPAGTELFEVDRPAVLRFKQRVLQVHSATAHTGVRAVEADLREDWSAALMEAGFSHGRRTAWLVEGLLYAMDESDAGRLLTEIGDISVHGSVIGFDHIEDSDALRQALTSISPGLARLWRSGPSDPDTWLRRHGWRPDIRELATVAHTYGRQVHPAYDPDQPGAAHSWLVTATRL